MIVVSGTKRSGTSMWMQILAAAGLPILGEPYLKSWERTIGEANPNGFFESPYRKGIYYATNPDPQTRHYLRAADTHTTAVKIFAVGVTRTERAYLDRVLVTVRDWRQYGRSLARLYDMENANRPDRDKALHDGTPVPSPSHPIPELEWWRDNFVLVEDSRTRDFPLRLVAYDAALAAPHTAVTSALHWLGAPLPANGVRAIEPALRTQSEAPAPIRDFLDAETVETFDAFHEASKNSHQVDDALYSRMRAVHSRLMPLIQRDRLRVKLENLQRQKLLNQARLAHKSHA